MDPSSNYPQANTMVRIITNSITTQKAIRELSVNSRAASGKRKMMPKLEIRNLPPNVIND